MLIYTPNDVKIEKVEFANGKVRYEILVRETQKVKTGWFSSKEKFGPNFVLHQHYNSHIDSWIICAFDSENEAKKIKEEILWPYYVSLGQVRTSIEDKPKPKIISAFPGTGKSYFFNKNRGQISDSDSSNFPKEGFPNNYLDHIEALYNEGNLKYILVSSHELVRTGLWARGLDFFLVTPSFDLKDEYLARYKQRGSPEAFINLIDANWEAWLRDCALQNDCIHIALPSGKYISDVF